jgi:hypothetical protein
VRSRGGRARAPVARASPSAETSAQRERGTARLRRPFMGATTLSGAESTRPRPRASCSGFALGGDERAARARNHPTATALHGCHHFEWCGVDVAKTARRAETRAKPLLEVVEPIWTVVVARFGARASRSSRHLLAQRDAWDRPIQRAPCKVRELRPDTARPHSGHVH